MTKYEIWIGKYDLGQGYGLPNSPKKVGEEYATSFKIACVLYEHKSKIKHLEEEMKKPNSYIEDAHFGQWYYNPNGNYNNWTGKYYETEKEAWESFKN
jgi:hypothetical protein